MSQQQVTLLSLERTSPDRLAKSRATKASASFSCAGQMRRMAGATFAVCNSVPLKLWETTDKRIMCLIEKPICRPHKDASHSAQDGPACCSNPPGLAFHGLRSLSAQASCSSTRAVTESCWACPLTRPCVAQSRSPQEWRFGLPSQREISSHIKLQTISARCPSSSGAQTAPPFAHHDQQSARPVPAVRLVCPAALLSLAATD